MKEETRKEVPGIVLLVGMERVSSVIQHIFRLLSDRYGLSALQVQVLHLLYRHGERTVGALSKLLGLSASTVSISVSKLEQAGYVQKMRTSGPRAKVYVMLTATGREVAEAVDRRLSRVAARLERAGVVKDAIVALQRLIRVLWESGLATGVGVCWTCEFFEIEEKGNGQVGYRCRYLRRSLSGEELRFDCPDYEPEVQEEDELV